MLYNDNDIKIADFRHGDIGVGVGNALEDKDTLYLIQCDEDMIDNLEQGEMDISGKKLSEINTQIAMVFSKVEDVDLILRNLFEIRHTFSPNDNKLVQVIKFGEKKIGVSGLGNTLYIMDNDFKTDADEIQGQEVIDLIQKNTRTILDFDSEKSVDIVIEALQNIKKNYEVKTL